MTYPPIAKETLWQFGTAASTYMGSKFEQECLVCNGTGSGYCSFFKAIFLAIVWSKENNKSYH
jgi:hypothetical protein